MATARPAAGLPEDKARGTLGPGRRGHLPRGFLWQRCRHADTIASMTGAISGAWFGVEAVPGEWVEKLENRDYVEYLAHRLFEVASGRREG